MQGEQTATEHSMLRATSRRLTAALPAVRGDVTLVFVRTYNEDGMIKKLSAVGNSLGLIIERPILELLDITK
ncbi:MAG: hypothetical protein M3Y87_15025, partial [Myxococcota bacterium]|nr:hypothetical protein [Myxococcota bacterium]